MTEDEEMVARALDAAEGGDAGYWPTVASILATEVRRLRHEAEVVAGEHRWTSMMHPENVRWRKWAGALVGLDFEAIQPFADADLRRRVASHVQVLRGLLRRGLNVEARTPAESVEKWTRWEYEVREVLERVDG